MYDFSILYTAILHDEIEFRLFDIIDSCFVNKNGEIKYLYLVISHKNTLFFKYHSDSVPKFSKVEFKKMMEFLISDSL
jgi:hypothetical protein